MKIAFLTADDPTDKRSWSGTYYQMFTALKKQGFSVVPFGPVILDKYTSSFLSKILFLVQLYHKYIYGKRYNSAHSHWVSFFHGRFFQRKLRSKKVDVIFAPAASNQIAHLKTTIPICYYSDATVAVILDYYEAFSGLSKASKRESNQIEQRAIDRSTTQVFSSNWALDSAVNDYKAKKPFMVKMGANIENEPPDSVIMKDYTGPLKLLFIGVDWKRKGGNIVLETLEKLNINGYDVHLTVIGCTLPNCYSNMTVIPNLNKNIEKDRVLLNEIMSRSHILFLPTRADCTPIVICEANAYGLPVISTKTGGVSSVIEDGINGFLLPLSAGSTEYFNVIKNLILEKSKLIELAKSSREKYLTELNWTQWGIEMKKILLETHSLRNLRD
jgi:glycosyltransferase involved in cell wall biosynthesis